MVVTTLLLLVSTAAVPAGVRLEAVSPAGFTLETPRLDVHGGTIHVEGTVCRRPFHLGISPEKVQIERLSVDGTVAATQFAPLPPLPRRIDQRCGRFGVALDPAPIAGEVIRVCLTRSGAARRGETRPSG